MSNTRTFQFSCDMFSGYRVDVDLECVESLQEVIDYCVNDLRLFLNNNNLEVLVHKLNLIDYHMHDISFGDILLSQKVNRPQFYICNHGCYDNKSDNE